MPRGRTRVAESLTDRLAAALEQHVDQADIDAGRGSTLDRGGNVKRCGETLGLDLARANSIFQGIRKRMGPQAR